MPPSFEPVYCPYCGEKLGSTSVEGRERLYCEACDRVIWRNADPVAAVIVREDEKILFIKRGIEPGKGEWSLPAGFLELEESPSEAAVRELEEETGLKVEEEDLEFMDAVNMERFPGQRLVATVYTVEIDQASGKISPGSDAEKASFWRIKDFEESDETLRKHFISALGL
ncbi:NUDIX hydrolase [Candidatus Nanosalina sp. VS9-1]|uniref:NUDIX hydrolase n=1 Tax=Candidatus Nanosalina sp. VS9-1 TaxID=3388566 RepID=UPI0039DFA43B